MASAAARLVIGVTADVDDTTPFHFDYAGTGDAAYGGMTIGHRANGIKLTVSARNLRRLADAIVWHLCTLDPGHYSATLPETTAVWGNADDGTLAVVARGHVDRAAFLDSARIAVARHGAKFDDETIAGFFTGVGPANVKHDFWRPAGAGPNTVDAAAVTDHDYVSFYFPCEPSFPGAEPVTYLTLEA